MIIDGIRFEIQQIKSRENVENPEVAKFKARTHNRKRDEDYDTKHKMLKSILEKNFPDLTSHAEADFYIPSQDLLIDDRLGRNHNYNLYRSGNGIQQRLLNELIEANEEEMIRQWCVLDVKKSQTMEAEGKRYLEIYSFKDEADVLLQIKRMSGLRIDYNYQTLRNELKNIITKPGNFSSGCHTNKITVTYQPHFYEMEQALYRKSSTRRLILENLMKYLVRIYESDITDAEILRQYRISRICDGFSQHSPYWMKAFIEKYSPKFIYDPTGGWGHRLLGSWNLDYIYNDIDERSVAGVKKIYNDFKDDALYGTKAKKYFYNEDAAKLTPIEDYDCVFSCPPYYDVESYLHDKTSTVTHPKYNDWLNVWWYNVVKSSLKPSVQYFAFIINNTYLEDMKSVCLRPEFNLEWVEDIFLNKETNLNHFHRIPIEKRVKMTDPEKAKIAIKNIKKGEHLVVLKRKL